MTNYFTGFDMICQIALTIVTYYLIDEHFNFFIFWCNYAGFFALAPPAAAGWRRKAGTPRTPPRGLAGPLEPPAE